VGGRPCYRFRGMRFKFKHSVHQVLISDASLNMGYVFLRCVLLVRQEGGSALWRFYLFFFVLVCPAVFTISTDGCKGTAWLHVDEHTRVFFFHFPTLNLDFWRLQL